MPVWFWLFMAVVLAAGINFLISVVGFFQCLDSLFQAE